MNSERWHQSMNKFNAWLWTILVSTAGVGILALIVMGVYSVVSSGSSSTSPEKVIVQDEEGKPDTSKNWVYGDIITINGSDTVMVPLNAVTHRPAATYSSSHRVSHNYLFVNPLTGENHWLMESSDNIFQKRLSIGGYQKETKAFLYLVTDKDTDGDGVLSDDDEMSLYMSDINGKGLKVLTTGITEWLDYSVKGDKNIIVTYRNNQGTNMATYDTDRFELVSQFQLPKSVVTK
jgi:hypothetical protein